ncbi:YHS domain-containing protein [Anaeromyxobacter oryzisoli]|uniref:YHS domain-containing protein n=1 Tax=Anaeromyxobacter oryzisoli TaxID=2925408 RepID=UPI001F5A7125|nr:YHS domain-containing protein [Anaeromyxobacter sp. SG63]
MAASVRDPVCGMPVDPARALSFELDGTRYSFCSEYCRHVFRWNPQAYAAGGLARADANGRPRQVAYLSMEVAIDPRMPTYSGGLGVLAGDTLRSCADLGLPLIGITLLHRKGYFSQALDEASGQVEREETWEPERRLRALPARVELSIEGRTVQVRAWQYDIPGARGVVPLLLLDTDLPENAEADRHLTDRLYGGDDGYRLAQEIVLGIGGVRMLDSLGHSAIRKFHLNEGHASLVRSNCSDDTAQRRSSTTSASRSSSPPTPPCRLATTSSTTISSRASSGSRSREPSSRCSRAATA